MVGSDSGAGCAALQRAGFHWRFAAEWVWLTHMKDDQCSDGEGCRACAVAAFCGERLGAFPCTHGTAAKLISLFQWLWQVPALFRKGASVQLLSLGEFDYFVGIQIHPHEV